ncbi:hypothetical protein LAZ67_1002343 [Cordylochernes scorpioides]|uniref:Uncharacterized protein n=1 Tax=Cordylochernes scorpioides TaxID=51811 RepID=A0ABY6JX44_9ARAC|nr:hypothetical protein LAZ67_1002343 [Cordylochernes scorpioides]
MEREEALERLKKKITILRTSLSKYGKRIEEYDVHKECDHEELLGQLSDVYEELRRVYEEIGCYKDTHVGLGEAIEDPVIAWRRILLRREDGVVIQPLMKEPVALQVGCMMLKASRMRGLMELQDQ